MYHKYTYLIAIFFIFLVYSAPVHAEQEDNLCDAKDRSCILDETALYAETIDNIAWRGQVYREIAKSYAVDGLFEKAREIMMKIETPDTRALTIRGIGMALSEDVYKDENISAMFVTLREDADQIKDPPSYAIALTYIAMAQAFAGDNKGAWSTAADMENEALRRKAYGETAEIQAEKGDFESARISIEKIDSLAFRNKAYATISKIFTDRAFYEQAYMSARLIKDNPYKTAETMQYLLDQQIVHKNPKEAKKE
ncbi:MAG: hypothetical protein GC137_01695 [Alphaproteobacteria bacterium]|nr:hypothetical protein [Alphaproteobacteria bacterium]